MKTLGIENRTENWKTASHFAPFFLDSGIRLRLAIQMGEPEESQPCDVYIELFWKGMRDYLNSEAGRKDSDDRDFAKRYERLFIEELDLRKDLEEFIEERRGQAGKPNMQDLQDWNYRVSVPTRAGKSGQAVLGSNLYETEVDIVLGTPSHLFIGEAKVESKLDAKSQYVLVHQLIREYVMARILVDRLVCEDKITPKKVIPFVVRNNLTGREQVQVDFMMKQGWLREENVLTWDCIKRLADTS